MKVRILYLPVITLFLILSIPMNASAAQFRAAPESVSFSNDSTILSINIKTGKNTEKYEMDYPVNYQIEMDAILNSFRSLREKARQEGKYLLICPDCETKVAVGEKMRVKKAAPVVNVSQVGSLQRALKRCQVEKDSLIDRLLLQTVASESTVKSAQQTREIAKTAGESSVVVGQARQ